MSILVITTIVAGSIALLAATGALGRGYEDHMFRKENPVEEWYTTP